MRRTLSFCAVVLVAHVLHGQTSWQPTNGPYGGQIGALVATSNGTVLAGSQSGAYRSTNNGQRWGKISDLPGLGYLGVSSFSHAGRGRTFAAAGGAFRSTDNGQTWTPISQGLVGGANEIAAGEGNLVFACSQFMFRSTDDGESWTQVNVGFDTLNGCFSLAVSQTGLILAGIVTRGAIGLLRSTDNGSTWGFVLSEPYIRAIAFNASGHAFIGTDYRGALRSTDNGGSWIEINAGLPGPPERGVPSLAIDGSGRLFAGTHRGVFRSTNDGNNWTASNSGMGEKYVSSLAVDSVGTLFAGTLTGVFRSTNSGDSWQPVNDGITDYAATVLAKNSTGHVFAGSSSGRGFFRSTNDGNSWLEMSDGVRLAMSSLVIDASQHLFAGSQSGGVFRSTDNGGSWVSVGLTFYSISSLAINANGSMFAGVHDPWFNLGGVFRSTNNGGTWERVDPGMSSVHSLLATESEHILAGSGDGVYRSTNNGETWLLLSASPASARTFAVNALGHIFAGTFYAGVFRSLDGGEHWTATSFGLPSSGVMSVAVAGNGHVLAAMGSSWPYGGHGVFMSTNNGDTWSPFTEGLTDLNVMSLLVTASGGIFAGTLSEGVFRSAGPTDVKQGAEGFPRAFSLEQNYPNPFNPSTNIKWQIPDSRFVTLKVYDLLGREVRTLVNENLQVGSFEVTFDATGLASGTYFYRLQAGEFVQTRKLLLLR